MRARGTNGQALPLIAVAIVLGALAILLLARVGARSNDQARARTAADAAALAGAADGEDAARTAARTNGAELVEFRRVGQIVEVTVQLDGATSHARAERSAPACARPREGQVVHFPRCPPTSPG